MILKRRTGGPTCAIPINCSERQSALLTLLGLGGVLFFGHGFVYSLRMLFK